MADLDLPRASPVVLQCGVAKSGNFWLYSAIQKLLAADERVQSSFIRQHPIFAEAKNWQLSFPEQASIDVLDITPTGYVTRISSRFEEAITNPADYMAQASHIWSHSPYRGALSDAVLRHADCIIYIVRDPRDVLLSMTDFVFTPYMRENFPTEHEDPAAYLADRITVFPEHWANHVRGYLEAEPGLGIHIVTYEEMRANLPRSLRRIARWLGISSQTPGDIRSLSVQLGFKAMRDRRPGHVNQGKSERWRTSLTEAQNAQVIASAGSLMRRFGYSVD